MAYLLFCDGRLTEHHDVMDNRGLAYGDGFFSTIGVHDGHLLFADGHRTRLIKSAERFEMTVDIDGVMAALAALARTIKEGVIKIIITRATQSVRGYGFDNQQACVMIKIMPSDIYADARFYAGIPVQKTGKAVCLTEMMSVRTPKFLGLKLISSHEQVFIHKELQNHQKTNPTITEGLVKSMNNEWVSGAMSNVFYRIHGAWHTPPVGACGVDGVMRQTLMARFDIAERALFDDDLPLIDGLFFCNAVRGVMPIDALLLAKNARPLGQNFVDELVHY